MMENQVGDLAPPRPVLQASIGSLSSLAPPPAAAPVLNFPKLPNASPIKAVPLKAAGPQKKSRSEATAAGPTPKKPRGRPKKQPELGLDEEEEEEDEMEADLGRSKNYPALTRDQKAKLDFFRSMWVAKEDPNVKEWTPKFARVLKWDMKDSTPEQREALTHISASYCSTLATTLSVQRLHWLATFYCNHCSPEFRIIRRMSFEERLTSPLWAKMRSFLAARFIASPMAVSPTDKQLQRVDECLQKYLQATRTEEEWKKLKDRLLRRWNKFANGAPFPDIPLADKDAPPLDWEALHAESGMV